MTRRPGEGSSASELRVQPLWARVDSNRFKLGVFVVLFVIGSAALLALAMVALPALLIGWGGQAIDLWGQYAATSWLLTAAAFLLLLAAGAVGAGVQLANSEDWVRSRLGGRTAEPGEAAEMTRAVEEMAIAAGLARPPSLVIVPSSAVNAFAVGRRRSTPLIGVTTGLLVTMSAAEQRAVAAALTARIAAGDILFGTALAALMGPLKAFRDLRASGGGAGLDALGCVGDGCANGCADEGCGCLAEGVDPENAPGCAGLAVIVVFLVVVAALTYLAVRTAAWLVTIWGRMLHRTGHEKADAEGMLLLKDPAPMVSALGKALASSNAVIEGDPSYDGVFYTSTTGRPGLERAERTRLRRLCEVLGVDGAQAWEELA